ncbi:MAG TPA: hypothetical protein VIC33_02540 [Vicinamibacterales bacterium]
MRTTLDLDFDVLQQARELAAHRRSTIGRVISELARMGIARQLDSEPEIRNGVPLLPRRAPGSPKITNELINQLRDELDI